MELDSTSEEEEEEETLLCLTMERDFFFLLLVKVEMFSLEPVAREVDESSRRNVPSGEPSAICNDMLCFLCSTAPVAGAGGCPSFLSQAASGRT